MPDTPIRHVWIDLLSTDGPFLSAAALDTSTVGDKWPTRLDLSQRDLLVGDLAIELDMRSSRTTVWVKERTERLLTDLLGYQEGKTFKPAPELVATHHTYRARVRADFVVHAAGEPEDARMVVMCDTDGLQAPDRTSNYDGWISTPVQRAALLARHARADLALVTDGTQHLLVNVVTGTTGSATWTESALEERDAQDAFVALLHKERVLHRQAPTSKLIELSQDRQLELTKTLGRQVRRAAEVLVHAISRANRTTGGKLLKGIDGTEVYAAATRVLMRTVFLLLAEERKLLPVIKNQFYKDEYAISTLLDRLEQDKYENSSAMQRRSGAWQRLLALARALHAGVDHGQLRLPAHGGDLFDPDMHPFLEGGYEPSDGGGQVIVGVVDDYSVLTVLRHLQIADGQRISFRSLDEEQIGHIYESLLDHSGVMVKEEDDAVLGLVGPDGDEPEIALSLLEELAAEGGGRLESKLVEKGVAGNEIALRTLLESSVDPDSDVARTISIAVGNDDDLRQRVDPYLPILRTDARHMALVFLPGDVYVTETSSKRDSGTAYTPRSLADEVAKHTLDPLLYDPGPQNEADESKWKLRSPEVLLKLKICDPAVGSAAILVAATRYLAEALIQSRIEHGQLPKDALDTAVSDEESLELRVMACREVVSRCIYGVDRDPMAVELAKLSLWLVTMAHDRPFTFLNHSIRQGDSLLGITSLDQLRNLHLEPVEVSGRGRSMEVQLGGESWWDRINDALVEMSQLRAALRDFDDHQIEDIERKTELNRLAEEASSDLTIVADAMCALYLSNASGSPSDRTRALATLGPKITSLAEVREELISETRRRLEEDNPNPEILRRPLHWPLVFPEVFVDADGFDAVVANPPFIKSQGLRKSVGSNYRDYCSVHLAGGRKGIADFVAYFAWRITSIASTAGFLATNSIAQGDTLKVGLLPILKGRRIYRAVRSTAWPGEAGVHISKVWITAKSWTNHAVLNDESVEAIAASLDVQRGLHGPPLKLYENQSKAFRGFTILAGGFEVDTATAESLIRQDAINAEVLRPLVNGKSFNGPPPHHVANRMVIDFGVMSEAEAELYQAPFEIVEDRVLPEVLRMAAPKRNGKPSSYASWEKSWWRFCIPRTKLRQAIADLDQVLALVVTSKVFYPIFVPSSWCLTQSLVVFAYQDIGHFGILSSAFHWWWAVEPPGTGGSSLKSDPRYTPTTSFQTFPQPQITAELEHAAEELNTFRTEWMEADALGLLKIYNMVNDPSAKASEVSTLRQLHIHLDEAVQAAYALDDDATNWAELTLDHDFHDCGSLGTRFTVSEPCREQMLDLLLELNFRRYSKEERVSYEQVLKKTGNA